MTRYYIKGVSYRFWDYNKGRSIRLTYMASWDGVKVKIEDEEGPTCDRTIYQEFKTFNADNFRRHNALHKAITRRYTKVCG